MRVVRMEIPMNFTMEYFEEQILNFGNKKMDCLIQQEPELLFIEMMEDIICHKTIQFHF